MLKYMELFITLTFKYNAGVDKEDTLPTILFTKEKLEMPLKENAGKMAEETDQPGNEYIRKSLVSMTTRRIIKWSSFCFGFFWRFGLRGN